MNKIFKVIWSKSKQCYVVVSEMAKNKTGKKKIVVASILAALAMQAGVVADVSAADRPTATIEGGTKMYSNLTNGLAIGNESQSNSDQSIAIGYRAVANSQYANPAQPAVAVGAGASATGRGGVSLGLIANSNVRGTAIGSATQATGFGAFAGGTYAQATNGGDVAIGGASSDRFDDYAVASGGYSVAIGTAAKADGGAGVSIGYKTNAKTSNSLAVGSESQATGEGAVAVGRKNTSTGPSSTVLGILSTANATSATAVGMLTTAKGENSLAVGHNSSAAGKNGVAVGTNFTTSEQGGVAVGNAAKSKQLNATAIGIDVTADAANSVALGGSATASSDGTIAIGSYGSTKTTATGNRALAIGSATTANGLESIAIGSRVNSASQHSIAIGTGSNASAVRSIALGPDSRATVESGVALGAGSVADRAGGIANKGYNPNDNRTNKYAGLNNWALTSSTGAVAVGNGSAATRQITGLAAGKEDTDAVNVAQLKSVNLAFAGNVGSGDVNLANSTLGLKGDNTYVTTSANGQNLTISGKTQNINVTNGQASAPAAGMADAKNVADSINKAISANAYNWKLQADNDNGRSEVINKEDTVSFSGDNNITVARNGKKITTSLNKAITVDTVKANKSVTVSSGGNQITLDGSNGAVTGKTFSGQSFTAGNNVLSNTTLQIGPTTGNNVTITTDGLAGKAGSKTVKFGTNGISAGGQQITDVSSGGNVGTNAANITDVKNAVSDVTLKLDTNSKTGTVKLSESPLKVIGANGIRTDLVGTNNGSLVVGLDSNTVNATTKGIGLTGDTGSTGLKYLKDGDATFKVAGDGDLVTTKASATGVQVAVDATKVKDLAVGAVTVSKANTADNPITITPTAGTNTKDYAIGIDTTKLADQTQLTYKANGANPNKVSLANGLNFTNGTFTTATVGANGNVSISTATETITNDADGKAKVNSPTDGLATAKNVADSINKAVDGLSQNLTVSDGTTDGTVNLKNQKLTVSGTNGVTATVNGQTVTVGLDAATKSKVDDVSAAVNRNISLGADSGTPSSQSLKDGDVAFNVKGATGDFVSTKMNGNTVEVSTKRAAINSDANSGAASVTGDDGIATAKDVANAINKAADAAKAGAAWNLSANGDTGTKVSGGDTVDFTGDNNITVTQTGKNIATTLNKDLKKLNSISLENGVGETIKFDAINGSGKFGDPAVGNYTQIDRDGIRINNGIDVNQPNTANTYLDNGSLSLQAGPNSSSLDSKTLIFNDEDGNLAQGSAQGMAFQSAAGKMVQFSLDEIKAGGNKIQELAEGTADTDAVNVKQLKDTVASQTLTYRANTAADADAKTVKLSKGLDFVDGTMTKATVDNDGKVTFDINDDTKAKINDSAAAVNRKVSLGADSGTPSSQSLKDGDVAFNVKGATGDFVSTKMNGDTVEISTKRATINSDANTGAASVTGDDGLATAKNVADAINKAASQAKDGAAWKLSANGDTPTTVAGGDTVDFTGDNNITVTQTGKNIATTLNKDLKKMNTISFEDDLGETIKFDATDSSGTFRSSRDAAYTKINHESLSIKNGETGANGVETFLGLDILHLHSGSYDNNLTSRLLAFHDANGNESVHSAQGLIAESAGGAKTIQFTLDEINAGGNKIKEVAEGTADTDAVNVKQLKDTVASQTLTYRANTAADADAKSVKLSKGLDFVDGTMTKATVDNDGKVTFDINDDTKTKINDSVAAVNRKVSLGADSGTASSQSLKDGDVAFNVKGATGDFVSTKMNGDTVEISTKRATIDSNATTGAASVTGDDGLATAKNVADAINKAASQAKDGAAWNLSTNGDAGTKVSGGDTVDFTGDNNITVTQTGKNIATTLNKDLKKLNSISLENKFGETVKIDGSDGSIKAGDIDVGDITAYSAKFKNSGDITKIYGSEISITSDDPDDVWKTVINRGLIGVVTEDISTTIGRHGIHTYDTNGTKETLIEPKGLTAVNGDGKSIEFNLDKISAGGMQINDVAEGTADTDAVNVKQLKDTVAAQDLTYRANTAADTDTKTVKLSKGLDFVDGTMTKATVDNDGKVTFDINDDTKTKINDSAAAVNRKVSLGADSGTVSSQSLKDGDVAFNVKGATGDFVSTKMNGDTVEVSTKRATIDSNATTGAASVTGDDGLATAKNVADAINAAKKSSKTEITANNGEAADGTTGNVVLTSSKAADGHTIYDVKLNDKVTLGTGANAVTLDGTTGTITGKTANIGGVTVDGATNHVTGLGNITWNGNAVSGRAATEDQLKAVADAAASQTWQITADKDAATSGIQTGTKKDAKVGKDAKVKMIAGENITINQNELDFTYSLNKDLVNMNSASFNGTGGNTTVINGDSITQTAGTQTNTSTAAGNTVADGAKSTATTATGTTITDGAKTNTSTADSTVIDDGNGNSTALTKDGVTITTAGKDKVSLTGNGLDNGNNKIVNVADGTNDTDAVNVRQLEAKTKASTTELTANGGESAGSTTGNIVLTKTTAADGHIIYDNKLNDKVTLGTDPTKAITVDGTNGTIKAGKDGNAVAINGTDGTIKAGDGTNAVAIDGKNGSVKAGDKIALDGKDGKATIGTVGIDGKDGVISGLANKTWDPNNITPGRAATEDQVKSAVADAGWDAAVGTEGSGVNSTPSATAEKVKPNETLTFKAGNNMMVSQNGKSISYALNPELTDMKSATFKDADGNTTVTNGKGVTITRGSANPNNPNAGPVSLTKDGLNNGNNQLKGIAPGTADTDAVNVGQLKASNAKIGDAIGQVAGEVQRVGAHAAAMAALKPIQYDPLEPTQVMAGVGNYRGETAAALGLAHYTNEDTMFNVGVSLGANRNMVNAGVTHKFGSSPEKKNIPDRYKAGPISSVYVMQDEVSSLKKENSEQKTVIADQAARLNTLEAENERQRQELAETKQGLEDLRAAVNQLLASKG
ncbi:ESPR-type extended signal peptide-containing protein [Veillonella rogosae]|uniref:ESPR-type extended signal peptide-containing protein n=1 Tax=Veillonella rogosae TaxID=423477 RepID=A0AA46X3N1_9FIRM|nr:ESPR-type extended signal peptide-containing protein [Veillonella rogosae]UZG51470.1 ESPR-type extended signal peptide-containing protein [Veillonella rogosae]